MSHELDIKANGEARFAYADHTAPWHRLGKPVKGLQGLDAMLEAAGADFPVRVFGTAAIDLTTGEPLRNPDGSLVLIRDGRATVRTLEDGVHDGMAQVGNRYVPAQNRDVLERAMAIVGAANTDAVIDTVGVTHNGARFFAIIDLGALIIDPLGVNDKIQRYLGVYNGHDGKVPVTYANTPIRWVCDNTVQMGLRAALRTFKARHTVNAVEVNVEEAQQALNISTKFADEFKAKAEQMLAIPVPKGSQKVDKVLNTVFPKKDDETDRQRDSREEVHTLVRGLWVNERNAGGYGENGWSLFNAVGEYLDHYRGGTPEARALTSLDTESWVTKKKLLASDAVLSLA